LCKESEASDNLKQQVAAFHAAYALYQHQQWDQAEAAFRQLHEQEPDTFLYSLYLERIASLRSQQLPPDWDETYRHTSK
jgi:adenylate cyclase